MTIFWQDVKIIGLFVTTIDYLVWAAALFWFLALTVAAFWLGSFLNRLTKGVKEGSLTKVLEKILADTEKSDRVEKELARQIEELRQDGRFHIQKVGLIRFNPFSEVGGDHSFALAILDGSNTGFVITSIHTRDRTRLYAKVIKKGKSEIELSSEERKALAEAEKNK